jgi:hypothetical protein
MNRIAWNMRRGSGPGSPLMPPGEYRIDVEAAGLRQTVIGRIRERIR